MPTDPKEESSDPTDKYTWKEGDIIWTRRRGKPLTPKEVERLKTYQKNLKKVDKK